MNKSHDYRALEREYITSQISLSELCRRHGISAHSLVTVQAKKGKWQEKREQYQARASDAFIEKHATRHEDRLAEIEDKALDAIDQALDKFQSDLWAKEKKLVNGESVEVPVMRLMPKDVAILLDRLEVLFDKPSVITQHQGVTVPSKLSPDALRGLIEATEGMAAPSPMEASPLPRTRRLDG